MSWVLLKSRFLQNNLQLKIFCNYIQKFKNLTFFHLNLWWMMTHKYQASWKSLNGKENLLRNINYRVEFSSALHIKTKKNENLRRKARDNSGDEMRLKILLFILLSDGAKLWSTRWRTWVSCLTESLPLDLRLDSGFWSRDWDLSCENLQNIKFLICIY